MEAWGMVVGMNRYDPSSSGGMNSLPSPGNRCRTEATTVLCRQFCGSHPKKVSNPSQIMAPRKIIVSGALRNRSL